MKILYVTTISLTVNTFFKPHISMLVQEGHQVDIACDFSELPPDALYLELGCGIHQIDFSRSPFSKKNLRAYFQLKHLISAGGYDIVHCHTPNASVVTRLVCRPLRKKTGLKVFYTAHGFHFYKGAPKNNWRLYYPIEKLCSRYTDKLITINHEDYALAKEKFHARETYYVSGVGVDLSRFVNVQVDRNEKRREIGVPEDALLLFSVGELNINKNHQIIIKAMAALENPQIHYAIAGVGDNYDSLFSLAESLGVAQQVHLLGFRDDIPQLNCTADIFCFPSFREGLSVSLIEAMACGLPIVYSAIRGNTDLMYPEDGGGFNPYDVDDCCRALQTVIECDRASVGNRHRANASHYSIDTILAQMKSIYES